MSAEVSSADFPGRPSRSHLNSPEIRALVEVIREGLITDGQVRLHNFGTFRIKWSRAHRIVHPRTGESMVAPAHPRVVFIPAAALRDAVEPNPRPVLPFYDNRKLQDYLEAGVEGLPAREYMPPPSTQLPAAEPTPPPVAEHEQTIKVPTPEAEPETELSEDRGSDDDEAWAAASAAARVDVNTLERDRNSSLLWATVGVTALALIPAILFLLQQDVDQSLLDAPDSVSGAQVEIAEAPPAEALSPLATLVQGNPAAEAAPAAQLPPEQLTTAQVDTAQPGSSNPASDEAQMPLAGMVATDSSAADRPLSVDDRPSPLPTDAGGDTGLLSDQIPARTAEAPLSAAVSSTASGNIVSPADTAAVGPANVDAGSLEQAVTVSTGRAVSGIEPAARQQDAGAATVPVAATPGSDSSGSLAAAGKQADPVAGSGTRGMSPVHDTAATAVSAGDRGAQGMPAAAPHTLAPGQHRVQHGDNLWRLAEAVYGDARMWPAIYQANAGILTDPNLVEQGQVLTLPARDAEPEFRTRVAEGYYLVYQYLRDRSVLNAHHFLIAAVRFDRGFIHARREEIPPEDQNYL